LSVYSVRGPRVIVKWTGVPVVGFAGHQEVERIAAARQAGCDHVAANSAITADPATVLRHLFERMASAAN
jgi:thiamine monophosphate synthase